MADYTNMLDMILTSHLLQKKRENILKVSSASNKQFSNILNQSIEKLNNNYNVKNASGVLSAPYTTDFTGVKSETQERFNEALNFVLKHEGKQLVHKDGASGESSKYGILQSTAKEFGYIGSIKDITIEDAKAIYRKIWEKSGAASLPSAMSVVHFDTYVNNPSLARKLLARSKGDINTYLKMREQQYVSLAEKRPEIFNKYLKGWKNRVNGLRTMVANIEATSKSRRA